jgi:NAD(P)-dependent dehydrogenase (short-subunit alcohol dehydrogenase family)
MSSGRAVVVTGAGSGIGAATAVRFARDGDAVTIADRDPAGLEETRLAIAETGGEAQVVCIDVTEAQAGDIVVATSLNAFGRVDVLVPAAGITRRGAAPETTDGDWQLVIDVDLTAVFRCCRAAISVMREQGGAIVTVGSAWGVVAGPKTAAYAAAKAGVVNLTRAIAIDHGPDGIRANCVCPGDIDTPLLREEMRLVGLHPEEELEASAAGRPVRRLGRPDDVAAAIAFLASEESGYITGTTLVMDGGWLAGG